MKPEQDKTIYLIDGSSFLYRAYYGLRPMHTPQGVPVQAVYSFCRIMKKLIDTLGIRYLAIVWDSKGKTVRHEMYEAYKATRQAPPSDLFGQKDLIKKFADALGIVQIEQPGVEADDLMFSLARDCQDADTTVVLVTSDKDMGQALDDHIILYDAFKEEFLDKVGFQAKMGFPVEKLPFYFALLGDASDNIPGVKGIGKKGAADLVMQFASLADMYEHLDQVPSARIAGILAAQKENAFLSEKLFLLQYYPLGLSKKDLAFDAGNWVNARDLFKELNFKSLLKDMGADQEAVATHTQGGLAKYTFKSVTTEQELAALCALLVQYGEFAIDTETTGLNPFRDPCIGMSFCVREGESFYVPFGHTTIEQQLSQEQVIAALKPILENKTYKKFLHHAKFDSLVLHAMGIDVRGIAFDSLIAARLLLPDWQRIGLKALSVHFFNETMLSFDDVVKHHKLPNFSYVSIAQATEYAAGDAHQTFKLTRLLQEKLAGQPVIKELYEQIELPLMTVLLAMEKEGVAVDVAQLHALDQKVTARIAALEREMIALIGGQSGVINFNSPRQIEHLLFTVLQLPPQKKSTKGTSYSTDQEVLQALTECHPVPALLLQHRELSKLKSTYIDALPEYINNKDHKIHTSFSQTIVATGRLASSDPNLQNIPTNTSGYGIEIRAAFKPGADALFLSADYSQIELRVLAYLSQDPTLVAAFLAGHDIHAQTAAGLFEVPLAAVTNEQRQLGKRINFSILYGLTPYGLSKDLGISFGQAKESIERYFSHYPRVSAWMEEVVEETKQYGFVTTHWGRRRFMPGIYENNRNLYDEARRVAINTKAQGTAAEIMKIGMIRLADELAKRGLQAKSVLQIHDELLLTVPLSEQDVVEALVKEVLEGVVDWNVPLRVTTRYGATWKDVTK